MLATTFSVITPTTEILINLKAVTIDAKELVNYENKICFEKLCEKGCPNYNNKWACPPVSPVYSNYSKGFSNALLVLLYCDLAQFYYTKTEYMKIKASNSILKSKMDRLMRELELKYDGKMLSNGSCRLCKPCNKKKNLICKRPREMRYSMESLGLDVEQISLFYFNHKLLWYKNKKAPFYSTVVSCLLTNKDISKNEIIPEVAKLTTTTA